MTHAVDFGAAELRPDPHRPGGWTLLVDGVAQSYVDTRDPTYLEFEYMRRFASVVDAVAPDREPIDVLHLGGGALTLPRYVAATRPGSRQRVVERDAALTALVNQELPPPPGIRVQAADARAAVEAARSNTDLILTDVYQAAQMPRSVASVEFARHAARLLRPGGLYAVNVADLPPLAATRVHVATLRAAFADVCLIAEPGLLRGRRYGNTVLVAAHDAVPVRRLARSANRDPFPNRLLSGPALDRFATGAAPLYDDV